MRFRHKKRGTLYNIFDIQEYEGSALKHGDEYRYMQVSAYDYAFASFQNSGEPFTKGFVVLYYSESNGKDYARPALEFFDGRFERI